MTDDALPAALHTTRMDGLRVRIFVGENERPTISFDLRPGVRLEDALAEVAKSIQRRPSVTSSA